MRYFFVGIGGVSMSALAKLLHHQGQTVAGSDAVASENTKALEQMGIPVYIGHDAKNLAAVDRLVINGAITDDNPELLYAQEHGIKILHREDVLAAVARRYQQMIAVAGCHGKSSTTAMIGSILEAAGLSPTVHNGAKDNLHIGGKQYFVTEACEFRKSFLKLKPTVAVITNVDADHLDCYRDLTEIKQCFGRFASKASVVIKNAMDPNSTDLQGQKQTITFGLLYGDIHASKLRISASGAYEFDVVVNPRVFGSYNHVCHCRLAVPGLHNVTNALAAITCALINHVTWPAIQSGLQNFRGVARRFEQCGKLNNTPVILDYAHHPREIAAMLQTANSIYSRYLVVFQPHTYTRTLALWSDFVAVLKQIPNLVLYQTFAARGSAIVGGRALDLSRELKTKYFATTKTLKKYLSEQADNYDAIILCGAGDVVSGGFLRDVIKP